MVKLKWSFHVVALIHHLICVLLTDPGRQQYLFYADRWAVDTFLFIYLFSRSFCAVIYGTRLLSLRVFFFSSNKCTEFLFLYFQVIYIKESNVIAPYRNERVSRLRASVFSCLRHCHTAWNNNGRWPALILIDFITVKGLNLKVKVSYDESDPHDHTLKKYASHLNTVWLWC